MHLTWALPPLPQTDNNRLAIEAKDSKEKMEQLIAHNIRLVESIIKKKIRETNVLEEDLVQEGIVGIITAANRYDVNKGAFSTYSTFWIIERIESTIRDFEPVKYEASFYIELQRYKKTISSAEDLQLDPESNEYASYLQKNNIDSEKVKKFTEYNREFTSSDICEFLNFVDNDPYHDIDEQIVSRDISNTVQRSILRLNKQEQYVILSKFGIGGYTEKNEVEIAQELGISRQRVNQIALKAKNKLRLDSTLQKLE